MRVSLGYVFLIGIFVTSIITGTIIRVPQHPLKNAYTFQSQLPLNPLIEEMVNMVSEDELLNNLESLVGFHTRHTSSDTSSTDTGIGAARNFILSSFEEYRQAGGGSLEASFFVFPATVCEVVNSAHKNVLATIPGISTPERVFMASGHMDNRPIDICDFTSFAPGANDDGSGTVVSMELARIFSHFTDSFESTVILMTVTGEDEGLYGSTAYADWALENDLGINGMITNDVVGNIEGCVDPECPTGEEIIIDSTSVRHFSGDPSTSTSRQLSRYMKLKAERYVNDVDWTVNLIPSIDRPGRGGDHMPFYNNGYPAVRFTEPHEYGDGSGLNGRQHNETDLVEFMDMPYLARIVKTNIAGLASLAMAPDRPKDLVAEDPGTGTQILMTWPFTQSEADFSGYRVAYRSTYPEESLFYNDIIDVGNVNQYTLSGLKPNVSLYVSVSAYDTSGNESVFSDEVLLAPIVVEEVSVLPTYVTPGKDSVVVTGVVVSDTSGLTLYAEIETPDERPLDSLRLYDDGTHEDVAAGDGLFANVWPAPPIDEQVYFVDLHITISDSDTVTSELDNVQLFTTIGPLAYESVVPLNDTIPNPGENLIFRVNLKNHGSTATATDVTAQLSSSHTCVNELIANNAGWADIPAGESSNMTSGFYILNIAETCPGGTDIPIDMSIASEGYFFWSDSFTIHVYDIGPVEIANQEGILPEVHALLQNYPNPFNPVTTLRYDLPERSEVVLTVYDIMGREARTLVQGMEEPGYKSVSWDGTDDSGNPVSAGVYLYRIFAGGVLRTGSFGQAGDFTQTRKMLLLK
ncbi:MAG: M28 family peptidase [Candidatus Neomarinimicrobiota bacterium]